MTKKRYVMVIDLKKCLGCKTCTIACNKENSIADTNNSWHVVLDEVAKVGQTSRYNSICVCFYCNAFIYWKLFVPCTAISG